MLAKVPSNCFAECTRCIPGGGQRLHVAGGSWPLLGLLSSSPGHGGSSCGRRRLAVKARTYTRIPMETAGAYQLIDEETGERVIVWGGVDDGPDSPLPPRRFSPGSPTKRRQTQLSCNYRAGPVGGDGKPRRRTAGTAGNFGKLKAQKVKALIRSKKTPLTGLGVDVSEDDADDEGVSISADTDLGAKMQKITELVRSKRAQLSQIGVDVDTSDDDDEEEADDGDEDDIAANTEIEFGAKDDGSRRIIHHGESFRSTNWPSEEAASNLSGDDGRFFSRKSFRELGCSDDMVECLSRQQFHHPSHIQALTYSHLLEGKSCIISDQSGSGKTLAYLAPTIQRLRQEELLGLRKSSSRSPRVLILVPTAELATQVLNNCRSIARSGVPFRSMVATGGFRQKTQLESLQQDLDILIATPGRFIFLLQEGFLKLNNLKCAVLDEVDILFGDEAFEQVLRTLINSVPVMTQYLFVTATLPVDIYNKLVEDFPDCEVIAGPGMHRTSYGLEEVLVDCSGKDGEEKTPETAFSNKRTALLQLVEQSPVRKTVIFCNKIETCRKVENLLKRFDRKEHRIKVLSFHAALEQESRLSNMKEFMSSQSADSLFLICTDRASRGIDFANVDHVVLFDFPRDPSEYIRRVGRTARGAGGTGKAFVFVVGKQVSLARKIMDRNQKGHPLHDLPST
ncbi:unnamed protein product [Spirodela intermedia]|uniref:Uncharacterized protein n=1 Tax=Spirodela intermedia TaxID=51605 RepID=A0A7I8JH17_SPIIN|nr:unnamed protein product [Spirodela intermedia]CAA6668843.1 unnamed protein product [Spirodela intermedia]